MSYANFKPIIWAAQMLKRTEEESVLSRFCNQNYEGEAKMGSKVKILTAGTPLIKDYDPLVGVDDAEEPEGIDTELAIDIYKYFNFKVEDIDKAQANPKLMAELMDNAAYGLSNARDLDIGRIVAENSENIVPSSVAGSATAVKKVIDTALLMLRTNGIPLGANVEIALPHWAYMMFEEYLIGAKTRNDELIKDGDIGYYQKAKVVATNNLHKDVENNEDDNFIVRTKSSVALATGIDEVDAYRPEKFFADAVKGLMTYGAKIIKPKEVVTIKAREK